MSNLGDLKYLSKLEYAIEARDTEIERLEVENRNLKLENEDLKNKLTKNESELVEIKDKHYGVYIYNGQ